jgi:hypothetical protein
MASNLTYAVEQRIRLIDFLVNHYGTINRSVLMDYFGISKPQASHDIQTYISLAPDNITYDNSTKTYRKNEQFKRLYA